MFCPRKKYSSDKTDERSICSKIDLLKACGSNVHREYNKSKALPHLGKTFLPTSGSVTADAELSRTHCYFQRLSNRLRPSLSFVPFSLSFPNPRTEGLGPTRISYPSHTPNQPPTSATSTSYQSHLTMVSANVNFREHPRPCTNMPYSCPLASLRPRRATPCWWSLRTARP